MKKILYLALVLLAPMPGLRAAFEPIVVLFDRPIKMPARLRMNEVTAAQAIVLVEVDAKGKLTDWLLLGASHRELIPLCAKSVPTWYFRPARSNGQPVLAQTRVTVNITDDHSKNQFSLMSPQAVAPVPVGNGLSGPVPGPPMTYDHRIELPGTGSSTGWNGRRFDYQVCPQAGLDHPPVAIKTVVPPYVTEAGKKGTGGRIVVHFFIDEQGSVRMPSVPDASQPELAALAIKAMKEWKFEPPTSHGQPVLVEVEQEFAFGGGQ